ncbi:MAG: tetratricopeptide repeat protein [Bryobacteraceae bacterium]
MSGEPSSGAAPGRSDVVAALGRIHMSAGFAASEKLKRFLGFVVELTIEGRASEIKEYLIATEVYGRGASYDPQVDSVVRVEASRLRSKLRAYYEGDGRDDPVEIRLPRGTYAPEFAWRVMPAPPRAEETAALSSPSPAWPDRRRTVVAVAALAAAGLGGMFLWKRSAPAHRVQSIAVLPFMNLSGGETAGRLADGITEDVTTALAKLPGLGVAGRTTMLQYKNKPVDIPALARNMRVDSVLEGSVRAAQGRIRITAQLISAADGYHLWAETLDRQGSDPLEFESDIVHAIATGLSARLAGEAEWRRAGRAELDAATVAAYSEGLALLYRDHHLHRNEGKLPAELDRAIALFEQVNERAPAYAPAWTKLAQACEIAIDLEPPGPSHMQERAKAAARKALELDETMADAWATLGVIQLYREWDWDGAEKSYRRAVEIDPRQAGTQREYADLLRIRGRDADAEAALEQALALQPESDELWSQRAVLLLDSGRFEEAEAQARRTLARQPDSREAHWVLGRCFQSSGRAAEAEKEYRQILAMSPNDGRALPALGHLLGEQGRRREALEVAAAIEKLSRRGRGMEYPLALVMAGVGDRDQAFRWLEKAVAARDPSIMYLNVSRRLGSLRGDPRFNGLLRRMHLDKPPYAHTP